MGFVNLQDLSGSCEVVVFPEIYKASSAVLVKDNLIFLRGKINMRDDEPKIIAEEIIPMAEVQARFTRSIYLDLKTAGLDPVILNDIKDTLAKYPGLTPVFLTFRDPSGKTAMISTGDTLRVKTSDELLVLLEKILGENSVTIR